MKLLKKVYLPLIDTSVNKPCGALQQKLYVFSKVRTHSYVECTFKMKSRNDWRVIEVKET